MSESATRGFSPSALTITSQPAGDGAARTRVCRLQLVYSPGSPAVRMVVLAGGPLVLGRDPGPGGLALADNEASRMHARVEPDDRGAGWRIVDLGSRNGMLVDGQAAMAAPLRHGTVIRLGASLLVYLDHEVAANEALHPESDALRGHSVAMQRVRADIALVAPHATSVLIVGETGVGKERVGAEIHRLSGRRGRYVTLNCAAIPDNLAENELFGHVGGAFTGALGRAEGLFQAADGGTLFLDEVGELPASVQAKLLRVLATGEVRPIGSTQAIAIDVRVVAATHRDIKKQAQDEDGAFRADLFARLSAWVIEVPPLRDRREDVLGLAAGFLADSARPLPLSPGAAEALLLHPWPFNVRELRHVVEAASLRAGAGGGAVGSAGVAAIRPEHLPGELAARVNRSGAAVQASAPTPLELLVDRSVAPSSEVLLRVIKHFGGNILLVSEFFGRHRRQVYRWMERYQIDPGAIRGAEPEPEPDA
jgi:sigma-54 dependent transcriptional regulator, acetoin dehydrogenase operon transcriptional activator AcoR